MKGVKLSEEERKERARAACRAYHAKHRDELNARRKAHRLAHPDLPTCRSCNCRKRHRTAIEFIELITRPEVGA